MADTVVAGQALSGMTNTTGDLSTWEVPGSEGAASAPEDAVVRVSAHTVSPRQPPLEQSTVGPGAPIDVSHRAARERRMFSPPPAPAITSQISGMQKWEGHVISVEDDLFTAELWPMEGEGGPVTADFDCSLIADGDVQLLAEGAVFYCTVRTVKGPRGYPYRTSALRMRRLGIWTEEGVADLMRRARERAARLERFTE